LLLITIQIQGLSELQDRFANFREIVPDLIKETMLESATENIVVVAKTLAPKKTGTLQNSISAVDSGNVNEILIVADEFYAPFLEYGTRAHLIQAGTSKALHWTQGGQDFFAKSVMHPGIPAGKFSFISSQYNRGLTK
jgi:Bacteriophage HK97-gp10, putative tail-component